MTVADWNTGSPLIFGIVTNPDKHCPSRGNNGSEMF